MSLSNFTSLPPEEEQQFVVFERYSNENAKKAWTFGLISGGVLGFFLIVLYLTSDAPETLHADALDSDIPAETSKETKAPAPQPAATTDEGDEGDDSDDGESDEAGDTDEGSAGSGEEGASGEAETPPPPKGATKAPPTDLVK